MRTRPAYFKYEEFAKDWNEFHILKNPVKNDFSNSVGVFAQSIIVLVMCMDK